MAPVVKVRTLHQSPDLKEMLSGPARLTSPSPWECQASDVIENDMTDQNTKNLRALFVEMAEKHEGYIEKLIVWKAQGVKIGPDSIDDIIEREDRAAKGLRKSIENLDKHGG
jgi:hypothetical protein